MSTSAASPPRHPALGTTIDGGSLELVSILGYGGYGVVYRAIDRTTNSSNPPSYAVKCLIHAQMRNAARQRRLHIQEITLHQLASVHPHVVTLHRVIEEDGCTFIVMDYCPDGDLFTQILHKRRYLGHDGLIKHVFLQLLDAVDFCHSLGIYHRDLKPENVLCFSGGLRLAITDFGLATTDRVSEEFRTGSVYHMSPECQGGIFAPSGTYSPPFNDIWSLGIILLNLITGRNPWKSASTSDATFNAYLQDPTNFLPSVLPISAEVNEILLQTLDVNWQSRITLRELRHAIKDVQSFYAEDVVFEGSMARCAWEAGIDITGESSPEEPRVDLPLPKPEPEEPKSAWSVDSANDEMVFAVQDDEAKSWDEYTNSRTAWAEDASYRSRSPSPISPISFTMHDDLRTPSTTYSMYSPALSDPSLSARPEDGSTFVQGSDSYPSQILTIDTTDRAFDPSIMMRSDSTTMHTALESAGTCASSFFLPSTMADSKASYGPSSTFEVGISTYGDDIEGQLQDAMSWTEPSFGQPSPMEGQEVGLSSTELGAPTTAEQATVGHADNGWREFYQNTPRIPPPPPPEGTAVPFPLVSFVSSPASSTPFPPSDTGAMRSRPKPRASSFFVRLAMPRQGAAPDASASAAPPPRKKSRLSVDEMSYVVAPLSAPSPVSPRDAPHCFEFPGRHRVDDGLAAKVQGEQARRRRRQPLRTARNWLFSGRLFA